MALFRNPYFLSFGLIYVVAVVTLATTGVYSLAEPIFMLLIFGILLPGIAYFLCRKCEPLLTRVQASRREIQVTFVLVAFIAAYLVWGGELLNAVIYRWVDESPRVDFFLIIAKKVLVFVLIPYWVLSRGFGYRWQDFGFVKNVRSAFTPPYLALMAVFFFLYLGIQFLLGQAAQPLFRGEFSTLAIVVGGFLLYILLVIEVGLVEEFFFRAVLQARLAAWLRSETAGLFLMALIFGLAHAPGLYLREAGAVTALGSEPNMASAVAYSVAVVALAGLAFGVIWAKTRNIYVLILIHAWVDTPSGLPDFLNAFGFR
jgi:membrane protease YdiL (CAAX protease family)